MITGNSFAILDIIDNSPGFSFLSGPTRILEIQLNSPEPLVWLINRERPHKEHLKQRKGYLCQPYCRTLKEIEEHITSARCMVLKIQNANIMLLKDSDLLGECKTEKERIKLQKHFRERDNRLEAIRPLVCIADSFIPRPVSELMDDANFPQKINARAKELGCSASTIRNWINRFWSGGLQRSALFAGYHGRCGSPGEEKKQNKKLGRSPRLFKTGHWHTRGYPLAYIDKRRLGSGFALITRELTPRDAYLLTCAAHWAKHEEKATGEIRATLFSKEQRPSFGQFMRWGEKLHQKTVKQIVLGTAKWQQSRKTTGRSERDMAIAVGQQGMFDGTSTDLYLVSFRNRLTKLPPLTRLILKESLTGIIFGVYCGWEPPSSKTALLAILHGASLDKRAWAKRFGVEIDKSAIPGLLLRHIIADNGELKSSHSTEFEQQFGVSISYTPAGRGDSKGSVETEHQRIHSHLDHRTSGTTRGKQRARGEPHPAIKALWNYTEYMRELIRWIIWHNTVEERPDLAPDDMLMAQPPVKPTRINIYTWFTQKGLNVSLPVDYNALRAFTLPDVEAVICKNGIRLISQIHGRKKKLLRLRYTSRELSSTGLLTQVKETGKDLPTRVKMDPNDLSQAWLPTRAGMIRVTHSERDKIINKNMVLDEWISYCEEQAIQNDLSVEAREQYRTDFVCRTQALNEAAQAEVNATIATLPNKLSKTRLISNLEVNRRQEIELLRAQEQALEEQKTEEVVCEVTPVNPDALDPADDAMTSFFLGDM